MNDWNSRLVVSYTDEDNNEVTITPIDSFTPTFTLSAEPVHSIEKTHLGVIYSPQSLTFNMTVKTIGPVAAQLTALAIERKLFDLKLQRQDGTDWAFDKIVMTDCVITSSGPSSTSVSGPPTATFSGFSLAASAEGAGATVDAP